jgi:hypothetical protein
MATPTDGTFLSSLSDEERAALAALDRTVHRLPASAALSGGGRIERP